MDFTQWTIICYCMNIQLSLELFRENPSGAVVLKLYFMCMAPSAWNSEERTLSYPGRAKSRG